ncbi:hypothetical protein [Haloferula sp. A504]|uniref:hypothetical protein n=1 Tax=Haloferula sp. A504 TaxID=3373601 RepID=UPI0031C9B9B3|nr:hypothetical protein [Verrucomicrobiaceae bacterium E54]
MELIATTFTGNVPHYDIIAADEKGRHVFVQVKTGRSESWQLNLPSFCEITLDKKRRKQIVGRKKICPIRNLMMVFVRLEPDRNDRFYICSWKQLRDFKVRRHKEFLARHNGRRPQKWDSLHTAVSTKGLEKYRDNWSAILDALR